MKPVLKSKMDKIRKHFQEFGGGSEDKRVWFGNKAKTWNEDGNKATATIRVLPPWGPSAKGFFYHTEAQHFGFSVGGRQRAITCPESINKGTCLVCKFIGRLKNSNDKAHSNIADRMRKNWRYFVNIIDRGEPDKVKIYGTNKKFIEFVLDESEEGDITDPKTGTDIIITRKGQGFKTRYSYRTRRESSSVKFNPDELYQLDTEVTQLLSDADTINLLLENYREELAEVGMKLKPAKVTKKSKPVDEEEDNEDNDDDSEEESEEEEDNEDEEEGDDEEDGESEEEVDDEDDED